MVCCCGIIVSAFCRVFLGVHYDDSTAHCFAIACINVYTMRVCVWGLMYLGMCVCIMRCSAYIICSCSVCKQQLTALVVQFWKWASSGISKASQSWKLLAAKCAPSPYMSATNSTNHADRAENNLELLTAFVLLQALPHYHKCSQVVATLWRPSKIAD